MDTNSELRQCVIQLIRIQQQMILEFEYMKRNTNAAVTVMSALDEVFARAFFAMKMQEDPGFQPECLPTWQEMAKALRSIGWTPLYLDGLNFWTMSHGFRKDPWEEDGGDRDVQEKKEK